LAFPPPTGRAVDSANRHCHIEQVEAVFNRGEARLRHCNPVAWLSPGRQHKQVKPANVTKPFCSTALTSDGVTGISRSTRTKNSASVP
jgi:hypothetical protein